MPEALKTNETVEMQELMANLFVATLGLSRAQAEADAAGILAKLKEKTAMVEAVPELGRPTVVEIKWSVAAK